jgi:hypothetical protein
MLKVIADTTGLFLDAAQMTSCELEQLRLGPSRSLRSNRLLEVGIGHLVGIELRAVVGLQSGGVVPILG